MRNFKIRLLLLLHLEVAHKFKIDIINTADDVIKKPTHFTSVGGYKEYVAATYDITGEVDGVTYLLRCYTRFGDDPLVGEFARDSSTGSTADLIYGVNITLDEEDYRLWHKENRFPITEGSLINRAGFCADELAVNLKDEYGNNLCSGIGNMPTITLTGGDTVTILQHSTWIEPGYFADDIEDGDITANVNVIGSIDTSIVGTHTLLYRVTDSDGGTFHIPRDVIVRTPNILPEITLNPVASGAVNPINLVQNDPYNEPGATALDAEDGDLTASIIVGGNVVTTNITGSYAVSYAVTDSDGATTIVTRTIIVQANSLPVITLNTMPNGDVSPVNLAYGEVFTDPGATAVDSESGNVTGSIVVGGDVVNHNVAGSYTISYTVTDVNLGITIINRIVNVAANNLPTVALVPFNGVTSPITLPYGGPYTEMGATAEDVEDGDVTASIVSSGNVDVNTAGVYVITYTASDSVGGYGVNTRVVNVTANMTPTITLNNFGGTGVPSPISLIAGDAYAEPGYSADDGEDGNLTSNVVVTGDTVDPNSPGTYNVTYTITDSGGITVSANRLITVVAANTAPVITLTQDANGYLDNININISDGVDWVDPGATALDFEDGNISGNVTVDNPTVLNYAGVIPATLANVGVHTITYHVDDSEGLDNDLTRTVTLFEDNAPVLTLSNMPVGTPSGDFALGTVWIEPGYVAFDQIDGLITGSVVVTGDTVDGFTEGNYVITYTVIDSSNQLTTVNRSVDVINTQPEIFLLGSSPQVVPYQDPWVDPGATANDAQDGDITANIIVSGDIVDVNTSGSYNVTYTINDANGGSDTVSRTVTVSANLAPVVTLLPFSGVTTPVSLVLNAAWTDPSASANDPEDGDVSASVVITGDTVDTAVPGSYTMTYTATDADGLSASITRTVNVSGNPPVIDLIAASDGSLAEVFRKVDVQADYVEPGANAVDLEDGNITANLTMYNNTASTPWFVGDVIAATNANIGTHNITYNIADSEGFTDVETRAITIDLMLVDIDLTADVYSHTHNMFLVQGTPWVDPGYTLNTWETPASDTVVVTGDVVDENAVLSSLFNVYYDYADVHGGVAAQEHRTITIVAEETMIELNAVDGVYSPINLTQGDTWTDTGAHAWDITDGDVDANVVVTGDNVNTSIVGTYTVIYTIVGVTTETVSRVINVAIDNPPTIIILGANPENIIEGGTWTDSGATANDVEDGDLTANIIVTGDTVDPNVVGAYNVVYNITDSYGTVTVATRIVNITSSNTPPVITITAPNPDSVVQGLTWTDPGATATDTEDGNITANIVRYPEEYANGYNVSGTYPTEDFNNALAVNTTAIAGDFDVSARVSTDGAWLLVSSINTDAWDSGNTSNMVYTKAGITAGGNSVGTFWTDAGVTVLELGMRVGIRQVSGVCECYITMQDGTDLVTQTATSTGATNYARVMQKIDTDKIVRDIRNDGVMLSGFTLPALMTDETAMQEMDTDTIGTQVFTYSITDAGGLTVTATRDVTVVANIAPTISLVGADPITIVAGTQRNWYFLMRDNIASGNNLHELTLKNAAGSNVGLVADNVYNESNEALAFDGDNFTTASTGGGGTYDNLGFHAVQSADNLVPDKLIIHADGKYGGTDSYLQNIRIGYTDVPAGSAFQSYSTITSTFNEVYHVVGQPVGTIQENVDHTITFTTAPLNTTISTYTDPGATANDTEDGDITGDIVVAGDTVLANTIGTYVQTYDVQDSSGTNAPQVTRTVIVVANTLPTITLVGDNPLDVVENTAFAEPGYSASDAEDGVITGSVVVDTSGLDISTVGTYSVLYTAYDSNGGTITETRTINVIPSANQPPVITLLDDNPLMVPLGGDTFREILNGKTPLYYFQLDSVPGGNQVINSVNGASYSVISPAGATPFTVATGIYNEGNSVECNFSYIQTPHSLASISVSMLINSTDFNLGNTGGSLYRGILYSSISSHWFGFKQGVPCLWAGYDSLSGTALNENQTYHIVITTYGTNGTSVWINGVQNPHIAISLDIDNLRLLGGLGNEGFHGRADEVVIYDHELSAYEIVNLYNAYNTNGGYNEPGFTVLDNEDGVIDPIDVLVTGPQVDVHTAGTYTVTYSVDDSLSLTGTIDRIVNVESPCSITSPIMDYTLNDVSVSDWVIGDVESTVESVGCPETSSAPEYDIGDVGTNDYTITDV